MNTPNLPPDVDIESQINRIHSIVTDILRIFDFPMDEIERQEIRLPSIIYMTYWYHRLRNNSEEQSRITVNLVEYLKGTSDQAEKITEAILQDHSLKNAVKFYVEQLLVPVKTVDLVVVPHSTSSEQTTKVLCVQRGYYPMGLALPGGIIKDEYESNDLGILPSQYAALRVAAEKILGEETGRFTKEISPDGRKYFLVRGEHDTPSVRIYDVDDGGYLYKEHVKSEIRPSDPRHIVDTIAFKCELEGSPAQGLVWTDKDTIMESTSPTAGFAFGHHREIVAFITAQTSVEKERALKERDFIRSLIDQPLASYLNLKARFESNNNYPDSSFPELFPAVDRMLADMFSAEVNMMCKKHPLLVGLRDKAVISLRQVCMKNRTFCPYQSTVRALASGIAFFDVVARQKRGFYDTMPSDEIIEHNPSTTPHASYHMYRYKYRYDQMMNMVPTELVIPTYESLSAADLLRVRGVPIRFIGLSPDFLYVDEFEQSPEEFFMHDCNHSWRMIMEDNDCLEKYGKTQKELISQSNEFITFYLDKSTVRPSDTVEERELKKIKKIILFEIVHEDARPFLKEVVCKYIQLKEGAPVGFEVPRIDPKTNYMDVVDTIDTGISTLSYVRNKLQHGFYDDIDAQTPQLVDPKYRSAEWIARAAYDMLVELEAKPAENAEVDNDGYTSYTWLLQRTCAAGPDNIHGADETDPLVAQYGDDTEKLNPKRYQAPSA